VKPRLLLALGNPLMGDDGVAWHLLALLRVESRLPEDLELAWGGTDLLACAPRLAGRREVILLDALLDDVPGELVELDPASAELAAEAPGAHTFPVPAALRLLRAARPELRGVPVRMLAVSVAGATVGKRLSPALTARLPALVEGVIAVSMRAQYAPCPPPPAPVARHRRGSCPRRPRRARLDERPDADSAAARRPSTPLRRLPRA